jgi:hypothetical protein
LNFILNITSPPDTPIDVNGKEMLNFSVQPTRYRASLSDPWVSSATDGGLLALGPDLNANCSPWCTSASLTFAQALDYNGEVEFSVRMGNSEMKANFSIRVLLSFSVLPSAQVFENEEVSVGEKLFHVVFIGSNRSDILKFDLQPAESCLIGEQLVESAACWESFFEPHGRPRLSDGILYKDLMFNLIMDRNGRINITLVASLDGGNSSTTFFIVVLPVNSPPSFQVASDKIMVFRDEFSLQPFRSDRLISRIYAGPVDEITQNLTFALLQLTPFDTCAIHSASVSAYRSTFSSNWTANFSFFTKIHTYGSCNLTLTLADDGGSEHGGINKSSSFVFTVIVKRVNQAPSFVMSTKSIACTKNESIPLCTETNITAMPLTEAQSAVQVFESSGVYFLQRFAYNISAEPEFDSGWEQDVTFTGETIWFEIAPHISRDGALLFGVSPFHYGRARFKVVLSDNGETIGYGSNVSVPRIFDLIISPMDNSPSFHLSKNLINVHEGAVTRVYTYPFFAENISAGVLELGQNVSFSILPIIIRIWNESSAYVFEGSDVSSGMAEFFGGTSVISMTNNGEFSFQVRPFRKQFKTLH